MTWQNQAECRSLPIDYFFNDTLEQLTPFVRQLCGGCPVRQECLNLAIATDSTGLWAGTTTEQRLKMRSKVRVVQCGTVAGWSTHQRKGQRPCEACLAARRIYINKYRAKLRANGMDVK